MSERGLTLPYLIATIASAVVTNWVYYSAREIAFLASMYHTAANTMGQYLLPMFSTPDRGTYFWLLAGVNCAMAVVVVLSTGPDLQRHSDEETAQAA